MRILHLAPHPDDELLGSPAVLMTLAAAGHEIVNLAVSLGRPAERARREHELREACDRAGFELILCSPPLDIGLHDDRAAAQARLTSALVSLVGEHGFELLVAPSPHDGHHGHEVVGRAAVAAAQPASLPLWMWGLWSDLPMPTILHPFGQPLLDRILGALEAHESQIGRNDWRRVLRARAELVAGLGPERVFGFGAPGIDAPYAEVLCEAVPAAGDAAGAAGAPGPGGARGATGATAAQAMLLGSPRRLDPAAPLAAPTDTDLSGWLTTPSPRNQVGP